MRIKKLCVKGFQGVDEAELDLGDLSLFYGANGAGKSSLADAILHALTGAKLRDANLSDLIRQGSKRAEVEVVLGTGLSVMRRRTASKGESFLQGVEVREAEAAAEIAKATGASPQTLAAALQAGHLLHLRGGELLGLLAGLTGARFDAAAIASEFPADVVDAAKRARLALPTSLEAFGDAQKRAEGARQQAKRTLAEREADLARMPGVTSMPSMTREAAEAALVQLRARRDAAVRAQGAATGRGQAAAERLAELAAIDRPDVHDTAMEIAHVASEQKRIGAELTASNRASGEAHATVVQIGQKLEALARVEAAPLTAAEREAERAALEADRVVAGEAKARADRLAAEGKVAKEQLDAAGTHVCETRCTHHCPDAVGMAARVDALRADYRAAKTAADELAARVAQRNTRLDAAEKAALTEALREQEQRAAAAISEATTLGKTLEKLAARADELRRDAAAIERWEQAQAEAKRLQAAAREKTQPVEDVAMLDVEIGRAEEALRAFGTIEHRALAEKLVREASGAVADADAIAQACGPKGVRPRLIARAAGGFIEAANGALGRLADGMAVELDVDGELGWLVRRGKALLRPAQLSEGERWRLRSVLQYAAAKLSGVGLVVLDGAEVLDEAGATAAKRLAAGWVGEGLQVVLLSCKPAPSTVPAGVTAYRLEAGRAQRILAAAA